MRVAFVDADLSTDVDGGAVNTTANWIEKLTERGVGVDAFCRGESDETYVDGGVRVRELSEFRPRDALERELDEDTHDVALVQNLWSDIALEAAEANDVPSVYAFHAMFADDDVLSEWSPTRFVANSRYTQQYITSVWGRDSTVVYPHIDFEFYTVPEGPSDDVSMVNPIDLKGGHVFREMAERLPDRQFHATGGWYRYRNDDFSWDMEKTLLQHCTFRGYSPDTPLETFDTPTDVSFDSLENVNFDPEPGIRDTYARTGVLVVPSLCDEAFGRVVLEAMWNRIPVVARNRGGIPEACGGAARLVDASADPDDWVDELRTLDDPAVYEGFAERGRARAERYRQQQSEQIDALHTVLEAAAAEQ